VTVTLTTHDYEHNVRTTSEDALACHTDLSKACRPRNHNSKTWTAFFL